MTKAFSNLLVVLFLVFLATGRSMATPIEYTFEGVGAGVLGSTSFGETTFVVSIVADTDDIIDGSPVFSIENLTATIDITSVGFVTLTDSIRVFVDQDAEAIGFGNASADFITMFVPSVGLGIYDLTTSFVVFDGFPGFSVSIPTDSGQLSFSSMRTMIFTAVPKLLDRGNGMIYDPQLDITWTQNANPGGSKSWYQAQSWVDNFSYHGFDDWRLPLMDLNLDGNIADCSDIFSPEEWCPDNELSYMYFRNLVTLSSPGLFTNIELFHWSGTEYEFGPPGNAWGFHFGDNAGSSGNAAGDTQQDVWGVWPVRPGDVRTAIKTFELFPTDVGSASVGKFAPAPTENPAKFGFGAYDAVVQTVNFDVDPFGTELIAGPDLVTDQYASIGVTMNNIPLTTGGSGTFGPATEPNQTRQAIPGPDQVQIFTFTTPVAAVGIVSTSPDRDLYEFFDESGTLLGSITDSGIPDPDEQFNRFVGGSVTGGNLIKTFKVTGNSFGGLELDDLVYEYPSFYTFEFYPPGVGSSSEGKFVSAPTEDPAAFAFGFGGSGVQTVNFDVDPFGTPLTETDLVTNQYASIGVTMDSIPLTTLNTAQPNGGPATEPNQTRIAVPGPDQVQTFTFDPPVAAVSIVSTTPDGDLYEFFDVSGDLLGSITDSGNYQINRLIGGSTTGGALIKTFKVTGAPDGGLELDDLIYQYHPVSVDTDSDGIHEGIDNCTEVANPDQRDSNDDGFGNACDADINNDCIVNFLDSMVYEDNFFLSGDLDTDNNGDGITNFLDLMVLSDQFFSVPGPGAGIACHGSPISYGISRIIDDGFVTGHVTTDGTLGALASRNIVSWILILDDGHDNFILLDEHNSAWGGSGLTADEAGLYFLFTGAQDGGQVTLSWSCQTPCGDDAYWVWELVGWNTSGDLNEGLTHVYRDGGNDIVVINETSNPDGWQEIGVAQ